MSSGLLCGESGKRCSILLLAREEAKRGREWLARPFMLPGGGDPSRMASVILIGRNI